MENLCTSDRVNSPISQYGGGGWGVPKGPKCETAHESGPKWRPGGPTGSKYQGPEGTEHIKTSKLDPALRELGEPKAFCSHQNFIFTSGNWSPFPCLSKVHDPRSSVRHGLTSKIFCVRCRAVKSHMDSREDFGGTRGHATQIWGQSCYLRSCLYIYNYVYVLHSTT